jgi:hypothetical protein
MGLAAFNRMREQEAQRLAEEAEKHEPTAEQSENTVKPDKSRARRKTPDTD